MSDIILKPLTKEHRHEYADMLHVSFNTWYAKRGWPGDYFKCQVNETGIFFDIYDELTPGCNISAFNRHTGRLMGTCFYHPRPQHYSFGIMSVHPNYFKRGVGKLMTKHIIDMANKEKKPLRMVGSAFNVDSFSLYNRSGFVPRESYNDMVIQLPANHGGFADPARDRVRPAQLADIPAMAQVEKAISGITRELDYRYVIENKRGIFDVLVIDSSTGNGIDGFLISVKHPALNMMGPGVAKTEEDMRGLMSKACDFYRGTWALCVIPMQKRKLVECFYEWGARNVETHLFQVYGEFYGFNGVNLPSFFPETG